MKLNDREIEHYVAPDICEEVAKLTKEYRQLRWWWQRSALERVVGQVVLNNMYWRYKQPEPTT